MNKKQQLDRVLQSCIIAVMRAPTGDVLVDAAEAILAGGIDVMEVTFTVPSAVHVLEQVADRLGDRVLLGAGTVLDSETARAAMLAGAQFVVSPSLSVNVIQTCRRYDKLVIPGAFTPTEVVSAWEAGADLVKIFPADVGGPSYLKALHGPLPQVRLVPTGGVDLNTAEAFLRAGACALGVGGSLVSRKAVESRDLGGIEKKAREFAGIVSRFRQGE